MASGTKERILDTAEVLFARFGIGSTSLRTITQEAGVNLASVNYHFGSREELVAQVFLRRLTPMNEARLTSLRQMREASGDAPLPLDQLVRAFVEPPLAMSRAGDQSGAVFVRLLGRTYTEPAESIHALIRDTHQAVIDAFKPEFERSLPSLSADVLHWRLHFLVGVLAYVMAGSDIMSLISSGHIHEPQSVAELVAQLEAFLVAGLQA